MDGMKPRWKKKYEKEEGYQCMFIVCADGVGRLCRQSRRRWMAGAVIGHE